MGGEDDVDLTAELSQMMEVEYEGSVLDMWEPVAFKELFAGGLGFVVAGGPEVEAGEETILDASARILAKYEQEVSDWDPKPSDVNRRALLVIGLALDDETVWSQKNEVLIARLFMLMYGSDFKGHADGVWRYHNCA